MSLWRNTWQTERALLMPAIIEAWFLASEYTCHSTSGPAGREFSTVDSAAWFDTKPEVNSSAACLPCIAASSASSASCAGLVPLMLRVPPAPAPIARAASQAASTTTGWPPIAR